MGYRETYRRWRAAQFDRIEKTKNIFDREWR